MSGQAKQIGFLATYFKTSNITYSFQTKDEGSLMHCTLSGPRGSGTDLGEATASAQDGSYSLLA